MSPSTNPYGLPEGVDLIDFKAPADNEYEIARGTDGEIHIYLGGRPDSNTSFRVQPAEGYQFVQTGLEQVTDIRAFTVKSRARFSAVRKMDPQTIRIEAVYTVTNAVAADAIREKWNELRELVGFDGPASSIK